MSLPLVRWPRRLEVSGNACRRTALRLFACFQLFYLLTASGRLHTIDEYETFYMTESLALRGELSLPAGQAFFGRWGRDGKFYCPYGPLPVLVALPAYQAGNILGQVLSLEPAQRETLHWFFTSLTNTTVAALCPTLFYLLALRLGAAAVPSLLAAVVLGLATPLWHYATTFFSEPLSAGLLLLSAYLLLLASGREGREGLGVFFLAGAPLALLAGVRLTQVIYFPFFFAAAIWIAGQSAGRRALAAALHSLLPLCAVALYLWWNHARFGDALQPGYPDAFEGNRAPNAFHEPFLRGLYGLTFSPGKGLFIFAIPAVLGLLSSADFLRQTRATGAWLLVLPLVPLLFYSRYSYWEAGYSWGPRFLLPAVAFWILPLAFWNPRRTLERAGYAVAFFLSGGLEAMGVAVSFLECQVGKGYYLEGFRYHLGYSALSETGAVLLKHIREALDGRLLAQPQGLGFDRWFFFLYKERFSGLFLTAAVLGLLALLTFSVWGLIRAALPRAGDPVEGGGTSPGTTPAD